MQDLMDLATSEPPPPRYTVDQIVTAGQRVQRRHRRGWIASGATATVTLGVAAAVTVSSVTSGGSRITTASPSGRTAAPVSSDAVHTFPVPAQPFTFTFSGYRVGKLRVSQPIDVSTGYQLASVYADGLITNDKATDPNQPVPAQQPPTLYAHLAVYQPGAYDPTRLANARPVTVAGRPGLETSNTGGPRTMTRTLSWQYGTNAWAVIRASSTEANYPSAADLRQLAAGLPAATPVAARIPFTMRYVPSGYRLDEVAMHAIAGLNGIASARDGNYAGLLFSRPALPTTGLTEPFGGEDGAAPPGSFQISVVSAANANQPPSPGLTCGQGFCNRWADSGRVNVQVASGGRLSTSEMTKILSGITLGNVHDDSTWTPVSTAIP
jgi:hypothetical protein